MKQALVLVDIQNDYFPGGAMELVGSTAAADKAAALLAGFRRRGLPIVHVQHVSTRKGATFFLPDTPGVRIHEAVTPAVGEAVITKHFPNAFRDTPLNEQLRSRDVGQLVIAGMMTHMCIDTTTRAAFDLGFQCTLAHDACATRALSFAGHSITAEAVQSAFLAALDGLFAKVQPADAIATALAAAG